MQNIQKCVSTPECSGVQGTTGIPHCADFVMLACSQKLWWGKAVICLIAIGLNIIPIIAFECRTLTEISKTICKFQIPP